MAVTQLKFLYRLNKMKLFKRILIIYLLSFVPFALAAQADDSDKLFKAAGWPVQIEHFDNALQAMQSQYKDYLPALLYQTVVASSQQRFQPKAMEQRAQLALRNGLADPKPALQFFQSRVGNKVVAAETTATAIEGLQKNQRGVPSIEISNDRKNLFKQLAATIPYRQATIDVSVALTSVVSATIDMWLPGMGVGDTFKQLTPTEQQIAKQVDEHLENILIYVYRDLSDAELQQFIAFADSSAGKEYYQVAQDVIRASVNIQ